MGRKIKHIPRDTRLFLKNKLHRWVAGETGNHAVRDRYSDYRRLLQTDSPIIVDGGAHVGDETQSYLELFPEAEIVAVEPQPDLAETIRKRFVDDERVTVRQAALGGENKTVELYQTSNRASSSVRKPTDIKRRHFDVDVTDSYEVEQVRLDQIVPEVDFIKLDLEGHELDALKGGEGILPGVEIILAEVEFVELNSGQALFWELDRYLQKQGFGLFNFYGPATGENGQLTASDTLYRRL